MKIEATGLTLQRTTVKLLSVKSNVRTGAYGGDDTSGRGQQSYAACNVHQYKNNA
jgi:hypothetical protein